MFIVIWKRHLPCNFKKSQQKNHYRILFLKGKYIYVGKILEVTISVYAFRVFCIDSFISVIIRGEIVL